MPKTNSATALAGVAVLFAGGVLAIGRAFGQQSNPPALAGDLEQLLGLTFEVAPLAIVLIVAVLLLQAFDVL